MTTDLNVQNAAYAGHMAVHGHSFYQDALTPEALFTYLSTRLQGLDQTIDDTFKRQKNNETLRSALRQISAALTTFPSNETSPDQVVGKELPEAAVKDIHTAIATIHSIDPARAEALMVEFEKAGILGTTRDVTVNVQNSGGGRFAGYGGMHHTAGDPTTSKVDVAPVTNTYTTLQLNGAKETVMGFGKDLEATAQLDMIQLQSVMSSRQTAIQLATNLSATFSESTKAIVSNVGR